MERRVLLAILLSAAVMYGYQMLVPPPPPTTAPAVETTVASPPPATPAAAATAQPPAPATPSATVTATDDADREIVVETATTEVTLANTGARVVRWRIKNYLDENGAPVDLVPSRLSTGENRPFSLLVDDEALTRQLNTVRYRTSGDVPQAGGAPARVDARESPATIVFDYADSSGLVVKKTFVFDPRNYTVSFTATVSNGGRAVVPAIAWGPGLGDAGAKAGGGSFFTGNYIQPPQGILDRGSKAERIARASVGEQPRHEGNFRFVGVDDHYFLAAAVNPGMLRVDYRAVDVPDASGAQRQLLAQTITAPSLEKPLRFFVGPKQFDLLWDPLESTCRHASLSIL